jgi:hypothetical protein
MRTKTCTKVLIEIGTLTLFVFLILSYFSNDTTNAYIVSLIMFLLSFFMGGKLSLSLLILFLSLFIFQFLYSLYGFFNGSFLHEAFINFSGFYLFLIYSFFFMRSRVQNLSVLIKYSLFISIPIVLVLYYLGTDYTGGSEVVSDVSLLRRMFSIISFLYVGLLINMFIETDSKYKNKFYLFFIFTLVATIAILSSFSKVTFVLIAICAIPWFLIRLPFYFTLICVMIFIELLWNFDTYLNFFKAIIEGYSFNTSGNQLRAIQLNYLLNDINFLGNGLGVYIEGFTRRTQGYGIELTYFNILHKYGFFSVVYLLIFFTPLFFVVSRVFSGFVNDNDKTYIYVFPVLIASFMNPMISAPLVILLTSYWWVFEFNKGKK